MSSNSRNLTPVGAHAVLAVSLLIAGCSDRGVQSYSVPKEAEPAPVAAPDPGPAPQADGPIAWDVPVGWTQIENTNPLRYATLIAGEGETRTEIAISELGGTAGGVLANVNRWRDQLGMPAASVEELNDLVQPIEARGSRGIMVDLVGPAAHGGSGAPRMFAAMFPGTTSTWFVKATSSDSVMEGHLEGFMDLVRSLRFEGTSETPAGPAPGPAPAPTGTDPASPAATPGGLAWGDLPAGWALDSQPRPMSAASFTVSDAEQEASLTITPLGGGQDLLSNINRWRGQVGLESAGSLDEAAAVELEVAGAPGHLVDMAGAQSHILAVVSERGSQTWFYKLTGPDPLVAQQRAAFEGFVRSIRFDEGTDG